MSTAALNRRELRPIRPSHYLRALLAMSTREVAKFSRQYGRLVSALVRPGLWLVVVGAGFQDVLGVSIVPPYRTYITYQEYMVPGLIGIVLLFNGMLSSLALVYDREMGVMRIILTSPLPRWWLLLCKLISGAGLSLLQSYVFLAAAAAFGVSIPLSGWLYLIPALLAGALTLGSVGLLVSVYIRQLENFAGTMNFVIFPMFFVSSALYPLWKLRESGAAGLYWAAQANPFTHVVELIRFAAYGQFAPLDLAIVAAYGASCFILAVRGYNPQGGLLGRAARTGA